MIEVGQIKKKIPIISLTAYNSEEDKKKILTTGADAHLSKPVLI